MMNRKSQVKFLVLNNKENTGKIIPSFKYEVIFFGIIKNDTGIKCYTQITNVVMLKKLIKIQK